MMKKYVIALFILSWAIFAHSSDVYPCYKPAFGWTKEYRIKALKRLGMAYCLGVKDDSGFVFGVIEEGNCRNSPRIINAQEAFNEIKKYIDKQPRWRERNQHLKYNDVEWCFSLYDKVEYHNKIQEIFYKYCEDCK